MAKARARGEQAARRRGAARRNDSLDGLAIAQMRADGACHDDRHAAARQTAVARRLIGLALVGLAIAVVAMGFAVEFVIASRLQAVDGAAMTRGHPDQLAAVVRIASEQAKSEADALRGLINIIFGPVVTLLGSVTGFYFGSKSGKDKA